MPDGDPTLSTAELIALGRDREAVAAATRDLPGREPTNLGGQMDGPEQLDEILPLVTRIVDGISTEQLHAPTPCRNFTVTGVLEHMISGANAFAPAFRGEEPAGDGGGPTGDDVRDRWRLAMADLLDAVHSERAMDRTIASPMGEVPGAAFARFVAFDGLIHGWDLSMATGQPYAPTEDVVREVDGFVRQALQPAMRDGDTFAPETEAPPAATSLERVVAFSGRQLPS